MSTEERKDEMEDGEQLAQTKDEEPTTIKVLCGANEADALSGESLDNVAGRLKDELNIPPTWDAWISYDKDGERKDEVVADHAYELETKVYELEFVKPGHSKG